MLKLKIEIIGKGHSRVRVSPEHIHWYISTALDASSAQKLSRDTDYVWNIHKDTRLLEPWFISGDKFLRFTYDDMKSVKEAYGTFFSSTISYMLATANSPDIVSEVMLNGIDLNTAKERSVQYASMMYFIGRLMQNGIEVKVANEDNTILKLGYYS